MPKKRKTQAPPQVESGYEKLHLEELISVVNESPELDFLKSKLAGLEKSFDPRKFFGYYHLALLTLQGSAEKLSRENQALKTENSRNKIVLEEFTIPTKAIQPAYDKEKEFFEKKLQEQGLLLRETESRLEKLQAEFESFRKRTEKKVEEAATTASERFVLRLLPILDNFERALNFKGTGSAKAILEGVEMIRRQMLDLLEKEGVERIQASGARFNPALHEAAESVATNEVPEETVVEEIRKGYRLKEKVIRPALVKIARPEDRQAGHDTRKG